MPFTYQRREPHAQRASRSVFARFGVLLSIIGCLVLTSTAAGAAPAPATPPFYLQSQITDQVNALGSQKDDVQKALDDLSSSQHVIMYVVYVASFDQLSGSDWATQTADKSGLGSNNLLFAVATEDHAYGYARPTDFALTAAQMDSINASQVVPKLQQSDWAGAAIAAANGYQNALAGASTNGSGSSASSGSHANLAWIWLLLLIVVAAAGFLWFRSRFRRGAATTGAGGPQNTGPPPEPYEALSERSVNALIQTDNAVRASKNELDLAEGEFGADALKDFHATYDAAAASLTQAFTLRQQIDDDVPEDEATRRQWMAEIIQRCQDASDQLEAQSEQFNELRDLKSRLPQVLSELPGTLDQLNARLAATKQTLVRLESRYSDTALASVAANDDHAAEQLQFAATTLQQAQQEATDPDTNPAVLKARAVQEAVHQVTALFDAVDRLDTDLADAAGKLDTTRTHVAADLADARSLLGAAAAGAAQNDLTARLNAVATIVTNSQSPNAALDPIGTLTSLTDADKELSDILAATKTAQQQTQRTAGLMASTLTNARSAVAAAEDFISTRRGAVGSVARTRLASAQQHLQQAESLASTDPTTGISEAGSAISLAQQALSAAQDDVGNWTNTGAGGGSGMRGIGGAILGGILINSVLNSGHRGGGWGGGFGGFGGGGFHGGGGFGGGGGGFGGGGGGGGGFSGGGGRF